ncbi:trans-cinnamate:CoA ligase, peroxisomal-like [Eucalyptus grandis]|uniref:trans-cinnamate:CoA ligase, peroxisomal-like n=1 Tax=Eucalyptus grandis TaxID=71139 RepID=UPI000525C0F4|nr:trans-cinnamate:CoA ligase, peroxisomal-like [Eucalyptus grandis]
MDCLPKCEANYVPLTPLTFLKRAASVYAARTSVVYESTRFTWGQTYERCLRLASSLRSLNVTKNGIIRIPFPFGITKCLKVSILAPNIPATYEVHFAVPMTGAILNTINTRLSSANIATILRHSGAKVFLADCELIPLACKALEILAAAFESRAAAQVIVIDDIDSPIGARLGLLEYEEC